MIYLKNVVSLKLDATACTGCGRCVEVCPHAVFIMESGHSRLANRDACMECGACSRNCPAAAIHVQTGVGCATGILNAMLGRKSACCCDTPSTGPNAQRPSTQPCQSTQACP